MPHIKPPRLNPGRRCGILSTMSTDTVMKDSTMFRKAAQLLSGEGKWMQGSWGYYGPKSDLGRYCAIGALGKVCAHPMIEFARPIFAECLTIKSCTWKLASWILTFNDAHDTTQADVVTLLLLESELAKSEGR